MKVRKPFHYDGERQRRIKRALLLINHNSDTATAIQKFTKAVRNFLETHEGFGRKTSIMCDAAVIAIASSRLALETENFMGPGDLGELFNRAAKVQSGEDGGKREVKARLNEMSHMWEPVNDLCSAMGTVERDAADRIWRSRDRADIALRRFLTGLVIIWHDTTGRWPDLMSLFGPEENWPGGYCLRLEHRLGNPLALLLDGTGLLTHRLNNGMDDDALDYMLKRACRRGRRKSRKA